MALQFEFESYGDKLISRKLLDLGDRSLDASPAFRLIADDLRGFERDRFDSRGYGTWSPLMPSTVAAKASEHLDPRVLHATLALRDSLTVKDAPDQELIITPDFMVFGTKRPYAGFLQRGTRKMVARKPLGFTEPQKVQVLKRLQRFIVTGRP